MVQVYGVAPHDSADANVTTNGAEGNGEGDESQALLTGRTVARATQKEKDGHASLLSCISNLSNTIIGSGASKYCYSGAVPVLMFTNFISPCVQACSPSLWWVSHLSRYLAQVLSPAELNKTDVVLFVVRGR